MFAHQQPSPAYQNICRLIIAIRPHFAINFEFFNSQFATLSRGEKSLMVEFLLHYKSALQSQPFIKADMNAYADMIDQFIYNIDTHFPLLPQVIFNWNPESGTQYGKYKGQFFYFDVKPEADNNSQHSDDNGENCSLTSAALG